MPEIRLTDHPGLPMGVYVLRIQGVEQARAQLNPDQILALIPNENISLPDGQDATEPVYGLQRVGSIQKSKKQLLCQV